MKPNQLLKYLNKGSAHTPACFILAIPHGVLIRLATITSVNQDTENVPHDKIHEQRISSIYPEETERKKAKKARDQEGATYFCIRYSAIWGEPLHKEIKLSFIWRCLSTVI